MTSQINNTVRSRHADSHCAAVTATAVLTSPQEDKSHHGRANSISCPPLKQPQEILLLVRVRRRRGRRRRRRNRTKRAERIDRRRRCPHRRGRNQCAGRQRCVPNYRNEVIQWIRRRARQDDLRRRLLQYLSGREPRRALLRRPVVKVQQVFCPPGAGGTFEAPSLLDLKG